MSRRDNRLWNDKAAKAREEKEKDVSYVSTTKYRRSSRDTATYFIYKIKYIKYNNQ